MIHPVVVNPVLSPVVRVTDPVRWRAGKLAPDGAILHWDASQGWQDQTGNQSLTLIGSAYPTVSASGALNESGKEWGFDLSTGAVRTAFLAGEVTIVMQVTMPAMSTLTDATDYSLWGDVLFVRRDGTAGSFKVSDGTNSGVVAYDWGEGEVCRVCVQADGDVMRITVGDWWGAYIDSDALTENEQVLQFIVHSGVDGITSGRDLFLDFACLADFSNLYFTDASGNVIPHYVASYDDCNVVPDPRIGRYTWYLANGDIITSQISDTQNKTYISSDNGATWSVLHPSYSKFLFVDSRGYYYAVNKSTNKIERSIDGGVNWIAVIDGTGLAGFDVNSGAISENSSGHIFIGRYQDAFDAAIYRSTDNGATFTRVYTSTDVQHVHGLQVDPYTQYVYAGVDGLSTGAHPPGILRSTDGGDTWSWIYRGTAANAVGMVLGDGYRLFGGEDNFGTKTVLRTTDDTNFTTVLNTHNVVGAMMKVGESIYVCAGAYFKNWYASILRSDDGGLTWKTIWISEASSTVPTEGVYFEGFLSALVSSGVPTGATDTEIGLGSLNYGGLNISNSRLIHGGDNKQAIVYLKIPSIDTLSTGIFARSSSNVVTTTQDDVLDVDALHGLFARYELQEGTGTAISDSSGNGRHATWAVQGTGSWNTSRIRRAGAMYPEIKEPGSSMLFTGDGYIEVTGSANDTAWKGLLSNFTVLSWIKSDNNDNTWRIIVSKGHYSDYTWGLGIQGASSQIAFFYPTVGGENNLRPTKVYQVHDGKSHMVGVIVSDDAIPTVSFVLDGAIVDTATLPYALVDHGQPVRIGSASYQRWYKGSIDDVQIYNRQLSAAEIKGLYERHKPPVVSAALRGPWVEMTAPLPLSAQPCKGHAIPIGVGKLTVFPGVASASQISEAKG